MSAETGRTGKGRGGGPRGADQRTALGSSTVAVLVLAALAIVLIAENTRQVRIRLIVPVVTMPLYLALLIMFVLGGLCGALLLMRGRRGTR
jgi:uncharacterized integral membrane protein